MKDEKTLIDVKKLLLAQKSKEEPLDQNTEEELLNKIASGAEEIRLHAVEIKKDSDRLVAKGKDAIDEAEAAEELDREISK